MNINKTYFDTVQKLYGNANEFFAELEQVGKRLGIPPEWIANVIWIESRFKTTAKNPLSNSSGLIQHMPYNLVKYNLTYNQYLKKSNIEQLKYSEDYLKTTKGKLILKDWFDCYFLVFYPKFIGKPDTFTISELAYKFNRYIDLNKDKKITKLEFKKWANLQLPKSAQIEFTSPKV